MVSDSHLRDLDEGWRTLLSPSNVFATGATLAFLISRTSNVTNATCSLKLPAMMSVTAGIHLSGHLGIGCDGLWLNMAVDPDHRCNGYNRHRDEVGEKNNRSEGPISNSRGNLRT